MRTEPTKLAIGRFSSLEVSESQEEAFSSSQVEASQVLQDTDDEFSHKITGIKENLKKIYAQSDLTTSLKFTQAQVDDLKKENQTLGLYLDDIELEICRNRYAMGKIEGKQNDLETSMKKNNLTIEGISEGPKGMENTSETVRALFEAMGMDRPVDYNQAYRLGPFRENKVRPLFITFTKTSIRNYVYSQRSVLKTSPNHYNVWVNDVVMSQTRLDWNVIRQVTRDAKEAGARCTSTQQALIIDGKRYDHENPNPRQKMGGGRVHHFTSYQNRNVAQ